MVKDLMRLALSWLYSVLEIIFYAPFAIGRRIGFTAVYFVDQLCGWEECNAYNRPYAGLRHAIVITPSLVLGLREHVTWKRGLVVITMV